MRNALRVSELFLGYFLWASGVGGGGDGRGNSKWKGNPAH